MVKEVTAPATNGGAALMLMECDTGAPRSFFRTFEFHGCRSKQCGPLVMESDWYDLENSSVEDIPADGENGRCSQEGKYGR